MRSALWPKVDETVAAVGGLNLSQVLIDGRAQSQTERQKLDPHPVPVSENLPVAPAVPGSFQLPGASALTCPNMFVQLGSAGTAREAQCRAPGERPEVALACPTGVSHAVTISPPVPQCAIEGRPSQPTNGVP